MLNPKLSATANDLAVRFKNAQPFRHVVIEDFLETDYCAELLRQFPPFERGNARNEAGELGAKSTVEKIRDLGRAYTALDDLIQTREFLDFIGTITGIPNLLYDPWYFGGGTHENREGQDLDPHVDFNRHPVERWHRRLNLIVYLNHEWNDAWGGSLELHSNPRAADDRIELITPLFNRAVIFETTETSWHGFSRIALPDRKNPYRVNPSLYTFIQPIAQRKNLPTRIPRSTSIVLCPNAFARARRLATPTSRNCVRCSADATSTTSGYIATSLR